MDLAVKLLAGSIGENDPAYLHYQAGLRDEIWKDGSIAVTEFTSIILATSPPTNRSGHRSRQDLRGTRIDFKELCGLNARDFSHASQEGFVNVLYDAWQLGKLILALLKQVRSALRVIFSLEHGLALYPAVKRPESFTERRQ
jgi:hypothetical protein